MQHYLCFSYVAFEKLNLHVLSLNVGEELVINFCWLLLQLHFESMDTLRLLLTFPSLQFKKAILESLTALARKKNNLHSVERYTVTSSRIHVTTQLVWPLSFHDTAVGSFLYASNSNAY